MLYDKNFLLNLDQCQHKVIYARITALSFQETPIEYIEGRVTQGSISLDGASAVRRTCSLTIAAQDFNHMDYYWGLNTKFKLEIGVENTIDDTYPNIIWFNQGIYLITSFSTSMNTTSFNISIQGKDKMCLLNGEVGGSLESSVDFGTIEEESAQGIWTIRKLSIQEIIKNLVHTYGGEPYHNIIINDLETYGLELLEYRYNVPLYLYRESNKTIYENALLEGSKLDNAQVKRNDVWEEIESLDQLQHGDLEILVNELVGVKEPNPVRIDGKEYIFTKIEYGQVAGYRLTDLVYAGDLIANVGESITSILDKIKTMLSEFEYFYNTEGQFIFQKKQAIKEAMWSFNMDEEKVQTENIALSTEHAYEFYGNKLFTALNNNPNLLNLKNDYSIWGEREGISGIKIPVHLRYAIDKKPTRYNSIYVEEENPQVEKYNKDYNAFLTGQTSIPFTTDDWDWREIIFQMAQDYYRYSFLDDFELRVAAANPIDYPSGRTGYEQYYIDLYSFWRSLYYPNYDSIFDENGEPIIYSTLQQIINDLTKEIYKGNEVSGDIGFGDMGIENDLISFSKSNENKRKKAIANWNLRKWGPDRNSPKYDFRSDNGEPITDPDVYFGMLNDFYFRKKNELDLKKYELEQQQSKYEAFKDEEFYAKDSEYKWWNKKIHTYPDQLNFWFDFLDSSGELMKFSVKTIGSRPKTVNDTNVKSIYFRETPSVIYGTSALKNEEGFRSIQAADIDHMFACSAQGKSAKEKLDELLYQHSYCIENATITSIPIYYLEPNTRVYLYDNDTGINGDYIVSKLTIPLTYNGTMSITATKAAENIL